MIFFTSDDPITATEEGCFSDQKNVHINNTFSLCSRPGIFYSLLTDVLCLPVSCMAPYFCAVICATTLIYSIIYNKCHVLNVVAHMFNVFGLIWYK